MNILFYSALFSYILTLSIIQSAVDPDFWARIIVGKTFFQTGTLLNYDFLSFGPTRRWFDHEWGSSLIFYQILDKFGDFGLIIFKAVMIFAIYFIITKIILLRRTAAAPKEALTPAVPESADAEKTSKAGSAPFNLLFFIFLIQSTLDIVFATIRCQIFTFLFFTMWLYALEKARITKNYKILWIIPATMLLWVNIHGGCFTGLGLLAIYIMGEFLNKKPIKPYITALFLSLAVMFVNPYGLKYVYFLFAAITMNRPNITEWQPIFSKIHMLHFLKYKIWAAAIVLITGIYIFKKFNQINSADNNAIKTENEALKTDVNLKEKIIRFYLTMDKTKAILLIIMLVLSIKTLRLIPFFAMCAAAFLYDDIYKVLNKKLPDKINNLKEILIAALIFMSLIITVKTCPLETTVRDYPVAQAEFLKQNHLKGNLLADFHYGSYLAYKLYPDNFIFMDGRYEETYDPKLLLFLKEIHIGDNWKTALNSIHADYIIAEKQYKLYDRLLNDENWKLKVESGKFGLFVNKNVNLKNPLPPSSELKYYNKTKWETKIDWLK